MADIKNVNQGNGNVRLNENQIVDTDRPDVARTADRLSSVPRPAGQTQEAGRARDTTALPPGQKVVLDPVAGRDPSQVKAARQLVELGGATALDRLLGLDMRPTMTGLMIAPPGNSEFLRNLSPAVRRSIMRKMLDKQREKMRRLGKFVRKHRDGEGGGDPDDDDSFIDVINEPAKFTDEQLAKSAVELDKAARMLDILEELLAMQDYTISQMGTFSQG